MELVNSAPRDTVTELLSSLVVSSSVYCRSEFGAPWGFAVEGANVAKFHLVLEGACWLSLGGQDPVPLDEGELVVLPGGHRHTISDVLGSPVTGLEKLIIDHPLDSALRLRCGGQGSITKLVCGGFALAGPLPKHVMALLPPLVKVGPGDDAFARIKPLLDLLRDGAADTTPGAQAVFAKLADVLLAQVLRTHLTTVVADGQSGSFLRHDPPIELAAALIRDQPARGWTVQTLAREVGMSRTSFATRFRAAIGESPMRHLSKVRLSQAASYLRTADISLDAIAQRTGYASNASLSKAFRREFGASPGAYRAAANGLPAPARNLAETSGVVVPSSIAPVT
jgi:AraC-like DNA-binding protein